MTRNVFYPVFVLIILLASCNKSDDEIDGSDNSVSTKDIKNYYDELDLEFVSRLNFHADDQLNYTEVKLVDMAERKNKINFTAETFFVTVGIYTGEVNNEQIDLAVSPMTVAETNTYINSGYNNNPYTAKTEWDFNKEGKLNIITYLNYNNFFPNYFGGDFGGYYNATDGIQMFSFKAYPNTLKGYMRNVNDRMFFVDMYRYKAHYENKRDSSWLEMPLTVGSYANSFDFETVGSDYGIVAATLPNALNVFAIKDTTNIKFASVETPSNTQFAGWDGAYTVAVYKNGASKNKPYVVIYRNSTVDIYLYDIEAAKLTSVYSKLNTPTELHFASNENFGNSDYYHEFYFTNNLVMIKTGTRLYKLEGDGFVEYQPGFPLEKATTITCVESCEKGIYLGLSVKLESGKRVADIVLLEK